MNIDSLLGSRCLIAGQFSMKDDDISTKLDILASLIEMSGGIVVGRLFQRRGVSRSNKPGGSTSRALNTPLDAAMYIDKGKAIELKDMAASNNADTVVFVNRLSGTQTRNLADLTNCRIVNCESAYTDRRVRSI